MAVIKCKMCGGELAVADNSNICVCDYCGTKQTVPSARDEILSNLFNRANNLRLRSEFDKAQELYEKIVTENPNEAEAYWGIVLCKYGIEYVEDPATKTRIPTCHRTQLQSILADGDYKSAITNADMEQKSIYEEEAGRIDEIQKDILKIVHNEKPFDVFICYKETDENGKRTLDSSIANDIYHQLTQEGFKVFYAAITLEDKLGQEYEPYIFAALNSAKTMLVLGTKPEYFTAVWVRNEWSRFMKLMQNDRSKLLIPCYRDMDTYDLPEEFAHLQAQDMGKIGFINDIVRGIKKVTDEPKTEKGTAVVSEGNANIVALKKRGFMALEDGEWDRADGYFDDALNIDAEDAECYLGKLMAELQVKKREDLKNCKEPFEDSNNYKKVARFGSDILKNELTECIKFIKDRNENIRLTTIYNNGVSRMNSANTEEGYKNAAETFNSIKGFKDAEQLTKECLEKAKQKAEEKNIANEKTRKEIKKIISIFAPIVFACIAFIILLNSIIIPTLNYINLVNQYGKEYADKVRSIRIGDTYKFGNYHGSTDWIVLDKKDAKILLISKDCIDARGYVSESNGFAWADSDLRKWLNTSFISDTFSVEEKKYIQETTNKSKNNKYDQDDDSTVDKVFLLSSEEAEKYFKTNDKRKAGSTEYAKKQGIEIDDNGNSCWWIREPCRSGSSTFTIGGDVIVDLYVNYVDSDGNVEHYSIGEYKTDIDHYEGVDYDRENRFNTNYHRGGIRPAMWIEIEK